MKHTEPDHSANGSRNRGFTLPEVTLALAVVAIMGLSVVGVSTALSSAYAYSQDYYQSLQTARGSLMRIQATLRKAKLVTTAGADRLMLWAEDTNGDGLINLIEVDTLAYDSQNRQVKLCRVVFPASMPASVVEAMNVNLPLQGLTTVSAITSFQTQAYAQTTVLASNVEAFQVGTTTAPPLTRVVEVEMTVCEGQRPVTLRTAVMLRADATGSVASSGGQWVLTASLP